MSAPTSPYTTSSAVAYLLTTPLKTGADFTPLTTPNKTAVDEIINWVSGQMDMQFGMAGYVLPFSIISGETWPSHQTQWLGMVATLGAAAMAGGHSLRPAPAVAPSRLGGTGNVFQDLYNAELQKIFDMNTGHTAIRFRAQYYASTPAENALVTPKGPTTDFMEGRFDPMRYLPLFEMADRVLAIERTFTDRQISWDYLYSLFNKGLGTGVYENIYGNF